MEAHSQSGALGPIHHLRAAARALTFRELAAGTADVFRDHQLLIQASAIAFRILLAMIPLTLFAFALLGLLQLDSVWRDHLAPTLRDSLSGPAYRLIADAVNQVLRHEEVFWITLGLVIAVWEGSSVVRAAVRILNAIYDVTERRSGLTRWLTSFAIAAAAGGLIVAAFAVVEVTPALVDSLGDGVVLAAAGFVLRWGIAVALLLLAVGVVVRAAPDIDRPIRWVSFGAVVVVVSWIVMSLLFGLYLSQIASYESVFGQLATFFVLLEYIYLSTVVFLGGLAIDSVVEDEVE